MNQIDDLEILYRLLSWPEDPESIRKRIDDGRNKFKALIKHEWLSGIARRQRMRILDLMGGTGVGSISLALTLKEQGISSEITIVDLRESALETARDYALEYLGVEPTTIRVEVEEFQERVKCPYDIVLIYGLSLPHLDPYQLVRVAANTAYCLSEEGVVVVEEVDRTYNVFYLVRYKDVVVGKAGEDKLVVSYHSGYDFRRGMFKRLWVNHYSLERKEAYLRYWDLAGVAGILWAFFKDVDLLPYDRPGYGFILAVKPRRVQPEEFRGVPRISIGHD